MADREVDDPSEFERMPQGEQTALVTWIKKTFAPHRSIADTDSYCLKHVFERGEGGFYVTNGQFKGAMVAAGFLPETTRENNWRFRIRRKHRCPYALFGSYYSRVRPCYHTPNISTGVCAYHRRQLMTHRDIARYEGEES